MRYNIVHMTGNRTIVTADIHGCAREFQKLMEKTCFKEKQDVFVFLGDAVDRGPESEETLRLLSSLKNRMPVKNVHFLLGNHEWKYKEKDPAFFSRNFSDWDMYYETADCIFVHAGWTEKEKERTRQFLLEDRSILAGYPQLRDYGIAIPPDQILYIPEPRKYAGKLTVAGHSPVKDPVWIDEAGGCRILTDGVTYPLPKKGTIFIDTGCYMGDRLTALVIENRTMMTVSVPYRL